MMRGRGAKAGDTSATGEPAEGEVEGNKLAGNGESIVGQGGLKRWPWEGEEGGGSSSLLGQGEDEGEGAVVEGEGFGRACGGAAAEEGKVLDGVERGEDL